MCIFVIKKGVKQLSFSGIQDVTNILSKMHKLFDIIRVVDPVKKQVIHYDDRGHHSYNWSCHDLWKRGEICCNCVTMRAMNENDTFMKIEYKEGRVFMMMASPIELGKDKYIIEMLKDITKTGIITDLASSNLKETKDIISELNKKAITDELTGAYNRRYINERLPVDLCEARDNHSILAAMMIDIDEFKQVNDTYGHVAGDLVLKELCKGIKSIIREGQDWIARYGGEEFLIILKNVNRESVYKVSEKIRKLLESKIIYYKNFNLQVTISIGAYVIEPGTMSSREVIEVIDKNLYKAKNQGKNKTILS